MQDDLETMIAIYQTSDVDWMGDKVEDLKDLTRHHIVKKAKGGIDHISNYALLTVRSHQVLHYLEDNNYGAYFELNRMFRELNMTLKPPTKEYYQEVSLLLKKVKRQIKRENRKRRIKKTKSR